MNPSLIRTMKIKKVFNIILSIVFIYAALVFASEFKVYPGAKIDEKTTKEANEAAQGAKMSNVKSTIYTTTDSFPKVTSFYKGMSKEYIMPRASGTSGKPKKYEKYDLYEAFFIFDGAKDLASSKLWVKVQRPYIGNDVRDITVILVTEKK